MRSLRGERSRGCGYRWVGEDVYDWNVLPASCKVYRFWSLRERVEVSASTIRFARWHKIFLSILGSLSYCISGMLLGFDLFYENFLLITSFSRTPKVKRNSSKTSFMIPVSLAEFKT